MTREGALKLIREYAAAAKALTTDIVIHELDKRFPPDGSEGKAMRWLGFIQGCYYALGWRTLDELKNDARVGALVDEVEKREPPYEARRFGNRIIFRDDTEIVGPLVKSESKDGELVMTTYFKLVGEGIAAIVAKEWNLNLETGG